MCIHRRLGSFRIPRFESRQNAFVFPLNNVEVWAGLGIADMLDSLDLFLYILVRMRARKAAIAGKGNDLLVKLMVESQMTSINSIRILGGCQFF